MSPSVPSVNERESRLSSWAGQRLSHWTEPRRRWACSIRRANSSAVTRAARGDEGHERWVLNQRMREAPEVVRQDLRIAARRGMEAVITEGQDQHRQRAGERRTQRVDPYVIRLERAARAHRAGRDSEVLERF